MSFEKHRGIWTKANAFGVASLILLIAAAVAYSWDLYAWATTGDLPLWRLQQHLFVEWRDLSMLVAFVLLMGGLLLAREKARDGAVSPVRPFLLAATLIALLMLGWVRLNDI